MTPDEVRAKFNRLAAKHVQYPHDFEGIDEYVKELEAWILRLEQERDDAYEDWREKT